MTYRPTRMLVLAASLAACGTASSKSSTALRETGTAVSIDSGTTLMDTSSSASTGDTGDTGDTGVPTDDPCTDAYSGNDAPELALPIPLSEPLTVSSGHLDHWTVEVPSGEVWTLSTEVLASGDPGKVTLALLQTDGQLGLATPYDLALYNSSVDPKVYTVVVAAEAAPDACVNYQLTVDVLPTGVCVDGVGDTWLDAAPLVWEGDELFGRDTLHNGDEDWFTAVAESEFEGRFMLDDVGVESGVVIELYGDPTAPPLAATGGGYSYEYFELDIHAPMPPGVYYVRVLSLGNGPVCLPWDYQLVWSR